MQGDLVGISSWTQERGKQKNHEKSAHFIDAKDLQFACADHIYLTWVESAVFAGGASLGVGSANTLARGGFPEKSILFIGPGRVPCAFELRHKQKSPIRKLSLPFAIRL